ncbi:Methylated-DNA--protein-cysteine methyltransferase [Planctomycetes bacterium Pan216]|uniref:methylated-DNA--[protein]-cysteine S-methyltransferase n=1 Tax=Kolteria novifilia TaxID=2527975 RepID=A0A518B988_9BACT|nr:Methylated-DNA--protein-cysteine methyltransferase [Planctomycetes bacterium Pan216]
MLADIAQQSGPLEAIVFDTMLGPMGLIEREGVLVGVRVGYPSKENLKRSLQQYWHPRRWSETSAIAERLVAFCEGVPDDFRDVPVDDTGLTPFRQRVLAECRQIAPGRTMSYAGLARAAGKPRAYRAVGSTMALNQWPIVVPCHRVLRSDGKIGGYSVPNGLAFKRSLLQLEARMT